jgi:hypothetical protein
MSSQKLQSALLILLALFGMVGFHQIAQAASDDQHLLDELKTAHLAAVQAMRSLHCTMTYEEDPPDPNKRRTGEYWRANRIARIRERMANGVVVNFVVKESERIFLSTAERDPQNPDRNTGVRARPEMAPSTCDVWAVFMEFAGPGYRTVNLDTFLKLPAEGVKARRVRVGGRDLVHLEVLHSHPAEDCVFRKEHWFDPEVNYHWRKRIWTPVEKGRGYRIESEVKEFVEASPGIHVPTVLCFRRFERGEVAQAATYTVGNLRINEPIPAEVFRLHFPYGTRFIDRINRREYRVDEQGREIEFIGELPDAQHSAVPAKTTDSPFTGQSTREAISWTMYIIWGSLALLCAVAGIWLVRWYRASRREAA